MIQADFLQVYLQTSDAWIEVLIYVYSVAIYAVLVVLHMSMRTLSQIYTAPGDVRNVL